MPENTVEPMVEPIVEPKKKYILIGILTVIPVMITWWVVGFILHLLREACGRLAGAGGPPLFSPGRGCAVEPLVSFGAGRHPGAHRFLRSRLHRHQDDRPAASGCVRCPGAPDSPGEYLRKG